MMSWRVIHHTGELNFGMEAGLCPYARQAEKGVPLSRESQGRRATQNLKLIGT